MTTLPERLKELASRMNQDGDKYDAFTLLAEAVQALEAAPEGGEWRTIDSAPEGRAVLLAIEYANGKRRVIRAMRAGERTLHLGDDQDHWDGCLYDEAEDAYYCAPGWYEKNEFDEVNWAVSDKPIAWQPLPAAPSPTAALQAGEG